MSSARYTPLPNPRGSVRDAEREMDDAFDDEGGEDTETTPLTTTNDTSVSAHHVSGNNIQGGPPTYDFEREYDYPPPGSPPPPPQTTTTTLPPQAIGNSNGVVPTSPVVPSFPAPRLSWFRRTAAAILPSHYQPLPQSQAATQVRGFGSGNGNDGVFANVTAKPSRNVAVRTDAGDVYLVPEDAQAEAPPSYAAASADAAPPYWETTVHAPPPLNLNGDMVIDDMPTGPLTTFIFTTLASWTFQLPGFLLTYLLHGTHAGRFGSQAGLALTLIQFGFSTGRAGGFGGESGNGNGTEDVAGDGGPILVLRPGESDPASAGDGDVGVYKPGREWISFLLMTIGWFLLLTSIIGYVRVKRFELSIRAAHAQARSTDEPVDVERDASVRRNLEQVFGITIRGPGESEGEGRRGRREREVPVIVDDEEAARIRREEVRLERELRRAGLL